MESMSRRAPAASTFQAKIRIYVSIRRDELDVYSYAHELTPTEGWTLTRLLIAADRHTHELAEQTITGLAEYVGLTREYKSQGTARRHMRETLDRLVAIGAISCDGIGNPRSPFTVTVLVYDMLVRFGPQPTTYVPDESTTPATTETTPTTVTVEAVADDTSRAYGSSSRAYERDRAGKTPPTRELDTPLPPNTSEALLALHDRVGREFKTTKKLHAAITERLQAGWTPSELVNALTWQELDSANDIAAVLTTRAERLGAPQRTPRLPDWKPEPLMPTPDESARARAHLALVRQNHFHHEESA